VREIMEAVLSTLQQNKDSLNYSFRYECWAAALLCWAAALLCYLQQRFCAICSSAFVLVAARLQLVAALWCSCTSLHAGGALVSDGCKVICTLMLLVAAYM
jgi:hypothetical protein